ncbi:hypothetical protein HY495_01190 [Candidatus Woesearchaeota archaeon]|nr:hypothetical protein [Candidatus Woesearchaeota archaeon]
MTINLAGQSLDNLIRITFVMGEQRWKVHPNEDNRVYVIEGLLFHYQLITEESPEMKKLGSDISEQLARIGFYRHPFSDFSGKDQEIGYWGIELWEKIPEEWRDIFFYHEIIEGQHIERGLSWREAHLLAKQADLAYREKHLNAEQQRQFKEFEQKAVSKY